MTPDGQRRNAAVKTSFNDIVYAGPEDFSDYDRCISRGVMGSIMPVIYNNGNQIFQTPGQVVIRYEMIHEMRVIPLDGRPHVGSRLRSYMGDARGHWEGDTLVVDTTNLNGRTGVTGNGRNTPFSPSMHLIERFTRVDADTIQYRGRARRCQHVDEAVEDRVHAEAGAELRHVRVRVPRGQQRDEEHAQRRTGDGEEIICN